MPGLLRVLRSSPFCAPTIGISAPSRSPGLLLARFATLLLLVLSTCNALLAQQTRQVLHNHVRPEVATKQAALLGPLPSDQTLNLAIVLPLRNQADLTALLSRLYDPSSPDYRHFLSVDQFTAQFGPTADDYQAVVSYALANGLTVTGKPANRLMVPVAGSVAQINKAFAVSMNAYQHPTENRSFFSPDREPSLELGVRVAHISGMNSFALPHPMAVRPQGARAMLSVSGSGPGSSYLASDMRAAYYGGTTLTGNGQVIGLVEFSGYDVNDVTSTFSNAGQTYSVPINNVLLDGATGVGTSSAEAEVVLDIVQAIGMAPGLSQVRVYIGQGLDDANLLNTMASENIAKVLSCSWSWTPEDPEAEDPVFQEFAAQGQSFVTASGDDGAFDSAVSPYFFPQEDAYVTAVGGTHLVTNGAGGSWQSESAWNSEGAGSGGGISPDNIGIPSWQTGLANSANGGSATLRNVPDVAMEGDFDNYVCSLGSCYEDFAGTSFAAPRWAGFLALVNEQAVEAGTAPQGGIGFVNPALYRLAQGANASSDFHDVTAGTNDTANQPIWFSAVAGYDLVTGWGSANGQSLIDDLAGPQVPGFWIQASSPTLAIDQGASSSTTLTISEAGGFSGDVSLAITSALPDGVSASWSTNPTHDTSVLTLTATSSAPPSSTSVTITGTSGTLSGTANITVAVHAPTFAISASPEPVAVNQGGTATTTLKVKPEYGFSGSVNLAVSGLPSGVTASLGTNPTAGTSVLTLTASSSATPGTTAVTITGTSGSLTVTHTLNLSIHGPSFTLLGGGTVDVGQGSTATSSVYVNALYGFTGSVNLAVSGLPSGVSGSFSPDPATGISLLTLTASSSAPVGTSTLTITGTSGTLTATTTLILKVHAPSFTLSNPGSVSIGQGSSGTSYIYVNPQYGFTGSVTFSVAGLPSGVTALWNPNPSSGSSMLTLAASNTAPTGQYTLTVTGTSGSLTATTTLTLGIYTPTFTLTGSNAVNVGQGSSISAYIYVTPQYGFTQSVNLTATGLPSGVTASFSPNPTNGYASLTLTASSTTPAGQYTVTITGTAGDQTKTMTLMLIVNTPTFTLSSYTAVNIGQGTSSTTYVSVYPEYGFTGSVHLSIAGLPSGVTAAFSPNPTTGSSTLTLTASSTAALGQYTATITGTSGSQTATTNLSVGVYVPSFTLSGPSSVAIGQGSSTTTYLIVSPQYGFNGSVNLAVSGLPAGVTAAATPNPTTGYSTVTLTASSTASLGQYTVVVTGTSGSQTASTTLTLSVFPPSFTLSSTYLVNVGQGSSAMATIFTYSSYGFNGSVNLALSGLPSGVTASFSPNPMTGISTLTLTASSTASLGQYTLTITGTSGSISAATTLNLGVYAPSFQLYDGVSSLSVNQGQSGTAPFYLTPQYGFSGAVTLTASGLPSGVTASFSPNPLTGTSSMMTLAASSTATPGPATVTITGTSGSLTATTTLSLTVNASTFKLSDAPGRANLAPGGTAASTVTVVPQNGFSGGVDLTVSGLPSGVTGAFSAESTTGTSTLTLTAGASAVAGTTTATITGTSGSVSASVPLVVAVRGALPATSTQLAVTAAGTPATSVASGTAVTLTAAVSAGSVAVTTGQVNFCDASATTCDPVHLLGSAQLTSAGSATMRFIPGMGSHGYRAVFVGTTTEGGSTSAAANLAVSSAQASTTTVVQSGSQGNYTLTASVVGEGAAAPSGAVSFRDTTSGNGSLGSATLAPTQTTLSFVGAQQSATGAGPSSIAVADLNGDGKPDLAVTNESAGSVTVLLGNGDGSFTASGAALPAGNQPMAVIAADFNGDGKQDLAVMNGGSNSVSIFLGNGDGSFSASALSPATGSYPRAMAVGDFNGDGRLDLVVANESSSSLTILLGNGDGTFTAAALSPQTGSYPDAITVADFNNDGIPDLAVANNSSANVSILLGNGDGSFSAGVTLPAGSGPVGIVAGDFNKDGFQDLAVANAYGSGMTILLGKGDGNFAAATSSPQVPYSPSSVLAVDLNGDGIPDLAVASSYANTLTVLLSNGDGTFASGAALPTGSYPEFVGAGDFTGDGIRDLVTANFSSSTISEFTAQLTQTSKASASGLSPDGGGSHAIKAVYPGDGSYSPSTSGTVQLIAEPVTPTVSVSVSSPSITTAQELTVTVAVNGGTGAAAPTGSVVLSGGGYTSAAGSLNAGAVSLTIPAGSLALGTDVLTATFTPDAAGSQSYNGGSGSGSVTVTAAPKTTPSVSVTLSSASITTAQSLTVTVAVGGGTGAAAPTGSVTLTGGGYTSAGVALSAGGASATIPAGALATGADALTASFTPDAASSSTYNSASGAATVNVTAPPKVAPTVTVAPSASSLTTAQPLSVSVTVSGGTGGATPTGSVSLSGGGYTGQQALTGGSTSFSVPAGVLPAGNDTFKATYTPDGASSATYTTAAQTSTVTVTPAIGTAAANVTATVTPSVITDMQSSTVMVSVSGGGGQPAPTGTVKLTSGSYTAQQGLTNGAASFTIPAGALGSGQDTITASYSGDVLYAGASGTTSMMVSPVILSASAPSPVSAGAMATGTLTLASSSTYAGTVNLSCTLASSPAGAQSLPTCSVNPASLKLSGGNSGTATFSVTTTAGSTASIDPAQRKKTIGFGLGGSALAGLLLFCLPFNARRRLPMLLPLMLLGLLVAGVAGCGGGSSPGSTKAPSIPGTTAGQYAFTIAGADAANANIGTSTSVTVTVQ